MKYFTETRVNVTKRIKKGLTDFFSVKLKDAEEKAENFASEKESYIYPLFSENSEFIGFFSENSEFIGYGIPK